MTTRPDPTTAPFAENGQPLALAAAAAPLSQILTLPSFSGAKVLAGESGLGRMVHSINTMEVPDVLPWVRADELLLTTGYPMRHNQAQLADFVADLAHRGVAGLAIKLGRYIDALPPDMLARADELGFPIVQVDDGIAFSEMLNQVLLEVLGRSTSAIERAEREHQDLMQLVLHGQGVPEVVEAVHAQLSSGDGDGDVVVALADRTGALTYIAGGELPAQARVILDDDSAFRATAFGHGVHDLGELSLVVGSVKAEGNRGHLLALRGNRPWTQAEVIALERGATVAALVLTREMAVSAVEHKYRDDLLREVLAGRISGSAAQSRAQGFGWNLAGPKVVIVAADSPASDHVEGRRADQRAKGWASRVRSIDPHSATATFASESVAVISCADLQVPSTKSVGDLVTVLGSDGRSYDGVVGVSRVVTDGLDGLDAAYSQAWEAVRVGRMLEDVGTVSRFDDLGLYRLLSWVPDSTELRAFLTDTLGELAQPEGDAEMDELRRTLIVLLDTNLNVAETARQMHFHYNTLRYRVNKLEKMLGPFTTDARLRADLLVSIYVWRMRGAHRR